MNLIFESWKSFLHENLLIEGRKEDAHRIIVKKINNTDVEEMLTTLLNDVISIDPSGKQKYLMWAAKKLNRVAELKANGLDMAYSLADLKRAVETNPEGEGPVLDDVPGSPRDGASNQAVYLHVLNDFASSLEYYTNIIKRSLPKYHKLAERNLIEKNIDKFTDINDFEREVEKAQRELEDRERYKAMEREAVADTDFLRDDDDYMIVRPTTEKGSCYFGRGTRWCISATKSRNYFNQYTSEGHGFYFVLFKHLPIDHAFKKMAMVFRSGEDTYEPFEVYDAQDDEVGTDSVREAVEMNILAAGMKELTKSTLRSMKGERRQKYFANVFAQIIEEFENWKKEWMDSGSVVEDPLNEMPEQMKAVFDKIGLLEPLTKEFEEDPAAGLEDYYSVWEEVWDERVNEEHGEIIGHAAGHMEDNPAGPQESDFEAVLDNASIENIHVSFDEYDVGRYGWSASMSFNFDDVEFLTSADDDEIRRAVEQAIDDNHMYPDEVDVQTWRGSTDVYISFQPDYDEANGLDGFQSFVNRIEEYDSNYGDAYRQTLEYFKEMGLVGSEAISAVHERYDDLDLENFEVDVEENELSISTTLDVTVPIPQRLWSTLEDTPSWQHTKKITSSPQLMAYASMIGKRNTEHANVLIKNLQEAFDDVFDAIGKQVSMNLPGEKDSPGIEAVGVAIPDYNINVYKHANNPEVGASGLIISYWFDIRIEDDQFEEEDTLDAIEKFLKYVDNKKMIESIRTKLENIVVNDTVKNVMPEWKTQNWAVDSRGNPVPAQDSDLTDISEERLNESAFTKWRKFLAG